MLRSSLHFPKLSNKLADYSALYGVVWYWPTPYEAFAGSLVPFTAQRSHDKHAVRRHYGLCPRRELTTAVVEELYR